MSLSSQPSRWPAEPAQVDGERTRFDSPDARAGVIGVRYESVDPTDDAHVGAPWAVVNTVGGFAPHTPLASLDIDGLSRQLLSTASTAPRSGVNRAYPP